MSGRNGRNPKSPAFQVYPGDFMSDPKVLGMTIEEVGAYWMLLCAAWIDDGIPNDPAFLARICRMSPERFDEAWKVIGLCWKSGSDNRLRNPRQERERTFQKDSRARRLAASEAANKAKGDRIGAESEPNRSPIDPLTLHPTPVPNARHPIPETQSPAKHSPPPPATAAAVPTSRPIPNTPHHQFIAYWMDAFLAVQGRPYGFDDKKDGAQVKAILKLAGGSLEIAKERAHILLHAAPEWIDEGGRDLGTLRSQWNKLVSMGTGRTSGSKQSLITESLTGKPAGIGLFAHRKPKELKP